MQRVRMAVARRFLQSSRWSLQNLATATTDFDCVRTRLVSSFVGCQHPSNAGAFSSFASKWLEIRAFGSVCTSDGLLYKHSSSHHQKLGTFRAQQVRHVYVEVRNNDLDTALKVFNRKLANSKVEEKLNEKRFYTKPCERRKLAKHYKKLNRARRELSEKLAIVRHRMNKVQEVRKIEREEKRAKAAARARGEEVDE
ncbi:hypothetical protein KP509_03G008300 [Ceratopteris richardii]|uniref:Ribosomal protein S21 n=1 Tax=Ceratopteris richardii TaxID=49495 RepID=A0A8T2UWZ5_CERRI|nr:hypothetical protein KP509_03G008300 [Ceratopteris richardii]